jgi:aryl-alcohol dehydrogenase-like predicted oxidoreductase
MVTNGSDSVTAGTLTSKGFCHMEYRQLGHSGVRVSAVGLGTDRQWGGRVDRAAAKSIVTAALESGINYIDTADICGTWYHGTSLAEEHLGRALAGVRDQVVLGTKGCQATGSGPNDRGASRLHVMNALEASLRRLRTDYVDLYQIHVYDPTAPIEETMRTLDDMVRSGKVRYIGASNYQAWQICHCNDLADYHGWERFVTTQAHYNLLEREVENELLPFCRSTDVGHRRTHDLRWAARTHTGRSGHCLAVDGAHGDLGHHRCERRRADRGQRAGCFVGPQ